MATFSPYGNSISLTKYSNLNLPEGFLINGKIVPSVASNNLTVSIKGMDGNDPSATNPVYIRIGGVVRSITGALSFLLSSGVASHNAGSAELATKEIDYFTFLAWSTISNSVAIGWGRSNGNLVSDFSETLNNEKFNYLAYSGVCNSTDQVVNIGRFAATLSAGAGYTWSVPTFTASNLIQKTKELTRWNDWTPTLTWGTADPATNVVTVAKYKIIDNALHYEFYYKADDGNAASSLTITLPFTPKDNNNVRPFSSHQKVDTTWTDSLAYIDDGGAVITFRNFSACTDTKAVIIMVSGSYEI